MAATQRAATVQEGGDAVNHDRPLEPGDQAARDGVEPDDPARRDPLVMLVRRLPRTAWYGLAALALTGIGVLIGVAISPSADTPLVEQGTVTWVNEGQLPLPGGPAIFLARLDGTSKSQAFVMANFLDWGTAGHAGWQVPGNLPPIPSCMVPMAHGRPRRDGVGPVRAHITFGVVHVPMPDGGRQDVAVWIECP